jgi:hypothetical protein
MCIRSDSQKWFNGKHLPCRMFQHWWWITDHMILEVFSALVINMFIWQHSVGQTMNNEWNNEDRFFSHPFLLYPYTSVEIFFHSFNHSIDGRTPWTSDWPVARPLPKHRTTQTQKNAYTNQTSMPCMGFEPTIPASERPKTVHALDGSATVTGMKIDYNFKHSNRKSFGKYSYDMFAERRNSLV